MAEGIWTPEKKRWKHLELEFIHQEQTPKEGITHLDEIRIRFIVCLSFIKLNWWQATDFAYYLSFLKRIEKWHIATWECLHEPPIGLKRTKGLKWYSMKKNLERTTVRIRKWLMKEKESPGRNNMFEGDLDAKGQIDQELIKEHLNEAPG